MNDNNSKNQELVKEFLNNLLIKARMKDQKSKKQGKLEPWNNL